MENQASIYVSESLNSFIKYLNEKYDSDRVVDDAKIKDEILFEQFLKSRSRRGINKLILNTFCDGKNVRRDLAGGLELKKNELQFRNHIADFLRNVREESKNGYRDLSPKEQEAILNLRLEDLGNLFGNYDIFFSRRKLKYRTGNKREYKKETLPLRKEATILVIRCYKPYGLFCEREQRDESIDLEEESPVLEEFREKAREYYQKHKEQKRRYYQEHKEEMKARKYH